MRVTTDKAYLFNLARARCHRVVGVKLLPALQVRASFQGYKAPSAEITEKQPLSTRNLHWNRMLVRSRLAVPMLDWVCCEQAHIITQGTCHRHTCNHGVLGKPIGM